MRRILMNLMVGVVALGAGPALGQDMADDGWTSVDTLLVEHHTPRKWVSLYEEGNVDALRLTASGGDVRCFSIEIWMADGRQSFVDNRLFEEGVPAEFDMDGVNGTIQRVSFNCRPQRTSLAHFRIEVSN